MGAIALTDAFAYVAGYDFSPDTNNIRLDMQAQAKDATPFGVGWNVIVGGLKSVAFDMTGFWQSAAAGAAGSADVEAFPDLGVSDRVCTVGAIHSEPASPASFLEDERVYMFRAGKFTYELLGPVGEVAPFTLNSQGTQGIGAKQGLLLKKRGNVSATGQLGATLDSLGFGLGAAQFLYGTIHIFTAGTSITIQVQSDDNTGFTTPTTLATIGPLTTRGGTWMTPIPGPLTDRYFRFNVSAITGTFNIGAAMANTT